MQSNKRYPIENQIIAAFFVILLGALIAFRFDYYYDLNDDMVMKDIVAGIYTGTPDGHNIQMLYPISWLISVCYHIIRPVSWYGIFIIGCQFGCLFLIADRTAQYFQTLIGKCLAIMAEMVTVGTFFLYELVFTQYTVTAALLGATATFLLYTTEQGLCWKDFIKKNLLSIGMVILAYQIRTEMVLLISPLICVAGACKWAKERKIFCRDSMKKYLSVVGIILIGMLLSEGVNKAAYGNEVWKTFQTLFDSRTELYDFQIIPEYEVNKEFYENIGLQPGEQELLVNYNFGLDEEINETTMKAVANYAKENRTIGQPFIDRFKQTMKLYFYMIFTEKKELPWNQLITLLYAVVLILALSERAYSFLWKLPFLAGTRSLLWLFLIYRERYPIRITHSLFIMELLLLGAMLLQLKNEQKHRTFKVLAEMPLVIIGIFSILYVSTGVKYVQTEYGRREAVNKEYFQLQSYCAEQSDNVYLLDVYSTVAYSEKIFTGSDNRLRNYEYLGGWVSKSPIDRSKLNVLGISTIEEAACENDNVYIISHVDRSIDWLQTYLDEKGYNKEVKKVDSIKNEKKVSFDVYQITNIEM